MKNGVVSLVTDKVEHILRMWALESDLGLYLGFLDFYLSSLEEDT